MFVYLQSEGECPVANDVYKILGYDFKAEAISMRKVPTSKRKTHMSCIFYQASGLKSIPHN